MTIVTPCLKGLYTKSYLKTLDGYADIRYWRMMISDKMFNVRYYL